MRDPDCQFTVDSEKLQKFYDKVCKEAQRLFPGEDGDSLVEISMRDRTRYISTDGIPVPHFTLLESDVERLDSMSRLACNASSAAERLDKEIKIFKWEKDRQADNAAFVKEMEEFGSEIGRLVHVSFSRFSPPPQSATKTWLVEDPSRTKEVRSLDSRMRKECAEYVRKCIDRMDKTLPEKPEQFLVQVSEATSTLRVYHLGDRQEKKA